MKRILYIILFLPVFGFAQQPALKIGGTGTNPAEVSPCPVGYFAVSDGSGGVNCIDTTGINQDKNGFFDAANNGGTTKVSTYTLGQNTFPNGGGFDDFGTNYGQWYRTSSGTIGLIGSTGMPTSVGIQGDNLGGVRKLTLQGDEVVLKASNAAGNYFPVSNPNAEGFTASDNYIRVVDGAGNLSSIGSAANGYISASSIGYTVDGDYTTTFSGSNLDFSIADMTLRGATLTATTTLTASNLAGNIGDKYYLDVTSDNFDLILPAEAKIIQGTYNPAKNNELWFTVVSATQIDVQIFSTTKPIVSDWQDLRTGGVTVSDGNAAGNDIRYRAGMSMSRDAQGMSFAGANPWSSWVKFEFLPFTRGDNNTVQWIFTNATSTMMIGIGSDATNETNTAQYAQMENEAYFTNGTTFWGLYGNNGTVGSAGNQNQTTTISAGATYKAIWTQDGTQGGEFRLFQLPSANPSDWDDLSNEVINMTIGGTVNPNEANLFPVIIPRAGSVQRFVAVSVTN